MLPLEEVEIPKPPEEGTYSRLLMETADLDGKITFNKPFIPSSLLELQKLTNLLSDNIRWVPDGVKLVVLPDDSPEAKRSIDRSMELHGKFPSIIRLPSGGIIGEVDPDGTVFNPVVVFYSQCFLSVGELFSLLSLFVYPNKEGTKVHKEKTKELINFWEEL